MLKIFKLKSCKRCKLAIPNHVRLSFYIFPLGDKSTKTELSSKDLEILNKVDIENYRMLTNIVEYVDKGDLRSLMVEGAIKGCATGADLGIYNYDIPNNNKDVEVDLSKFIGEKFINAIDDDNELISYDTNGLLSNCILAEPNYDNNGFSKVIKTFKGYLQVTLDEFSFIRSTDYNSEISIVYVPQSYVQKYRLRNGDELICTCKEDNGKTILTSLFTINKQSCSEWKNDRPWFNSLKQEKFQCLKSNGEFMLRVINKFNLYKGDNMFLYLNKTCQKQKVLPKLIKELENMFDYIVYLNPKYSAVKYIDSSYKIIKFCTPINAKLKHQQNIILLGANYAKRLVELGNKVAVVIDDAYTIMGLEDEADLPISKTVFSCAINSNKSYANSFTVVSLRNNLAVDKNLNQVLMSAETIGIMFDNNEIDTFNSYRV